MIPKPRNTYQKAMVIVIVICLLSLAAIALYILTLEEPRENMYLDDGLDNYLGSLPQPVKIFEDNHGNFVALTMDDERIPLDKIPSFDTNEDSRIYFDKYDDRVFYHQDHQLYIYDIQKDSTRALSYRGASIKGYDVAGVYKNRLLTMIKSGSRANTGLFFPHDLDIGRPVEEKYYTDVLESEYTILAAFTMEGTRYHIYADSRKKNEHAASDTLAIYLQQKEAVEGSMHLSNSETGLITSIEHLIFARGGAAGSAELDSRADLILNVPSRLDAPLGFAQNKMFRVGNIYALGNQRAAITVDDRLVVVDLEEGSGEIIDNNARIQRLLNGAELLTTNLSQYNERDCFINQHQEPTIEGAEFVFCLE